ncbi:MAG: hypothetical protein ABIQ05_03960 [Candidatus Limnocylindria bacterium]
MDVERIERALREGPADEPVYVPGTFRRARSRWSLAIGAGVVAAALVIGLVIGIGLGVLRAPAPNVGAPDLEALAAELQGTWTSDEITRDRFITGLVALGNNRDDVDNLLIHDPILSMVQFELAFDDGQLAISAATDGGPMVEQSGGPFHLLPEGSIYYDDLGCYITVAFAISGDRLTFQRISTVSCGADERAANSGFFNLSPYARAAAR